ncbi:unnamed protein product [Bursaphelenchus xylophilus]|uniref:(pine wood nematode) hypothetical protein n=1 Tax=Bursaphelenchus xylophilus TaxID=6326 RepID=A0A1I7S243_BURXY|nr:unnamed protein product [Bursaphelenchus xylophilus]CAG9114934.1 unnamed protein product [Bursaphelenchus xylophilus]
MTEAVAVNRAEMGSGTRYFVPIEQNERPRRTVGEWFRKYFLEGQKLERQTQAHINPKDLPFHERYRKYLATLIPFVIMHAIWWSMAIRYNLFRLYPTRYELAITMILGAFVAGATSEGGGAIAFPVMTLMLHIAPDVARDFSLIIQVAGMATSSFAILWMGVKVEWHSIIYSSIGAGVSIILGLQFWDNLLDPQQKKMMFVSIWFSFAISLLILNLQKKRVTFDNIPNFKPWKAIALVAAGFFGGILSAFTGSGVDICSFSILTLLFRVSEKVATPTSVILMFLNALIGSYWRVLMQQGVSQLAYEYFAVSVPVVVTCSPIGAFVSSHLHRQVLACFVYILETLAVLGFLITGPKWTLIVAGAVIIIVGFTFFYIIAKLGQKLSGVESERQSNESLAVNNMTFLDRRSSTNSSGVVV